MPDSDPLMVGMFWGGLVMASVPILLTVGVAVYLLRRHLRERTPDSVRERTPDSVRGRAPDRRHGRPPNDPQREAP